MESEAWQARHAGVEHLVSLCVELELKHSIVYRHYLCVKFFDTNYNQGQSGRLKVR